MTKKYLSENTELMQEWDWEANEGLNPNELTIGSNKEAWWICSSCGNKWQQRINKRTLRRYGCPNCRYKHKHNTKNNITITHPEIVKYWDYLKNGENTPDMFTKGSTYIAYWKCSKCENEWTQTIDQCTGCKKCKNKEYLSTNSLASKYPEIAKEWHPTKNGDLKTTDISSKNDKKVWWLCSKCGYEWQAKIGNRTILNRGCPCCSNAVVVKGKNDLQSTHPEIAKEWHPTKNGTLTPDKVSYGYGKKVWWKCPNGHEYQATVNHRTGKSGTNCPVCYAGRQTSFAEQAVFYYIKQIYPDAINRYKADFLGKMELDIYIPSIKLAVEYDGMAWHKENKLGRERKKYQICKSEGIYLMRLREKKGNYSDIADNCYCLPDLYKSDNLNRLIPHILGLLDPNKIMKILETSNNPWGNIPTIISYDVDVERDKIKILKCFATEYKKDSFGELYPEIAKEWHPTKNGNLTPYMFKPHSGHKVWWKCPTCGYEFQATIGSRVAGCGCRECGIKKSAQTKRKAINMIDLKTNKIIKTFISISEASQKMKISSGNIAAVCQGIRTKAGGYIWKYADEKDAKKYQKEKTQLEFDF